MRLWILPSKVLFRWRRWWRSSPLSCLLRLIYSLVSVTPGARPGPGTRHPFTVLRYKTPRCWKRRTAQFRCSGSATLVIRVRRHSVKMFRNSSLSLSLAGWVPTCPVSRPARCTAMYRAQQISQNDADSSNISTLLLWSPGTAWSNSGAAVWMWCGPCAMLCEMCDVLVGGCVVELSTNLSEVP